MYTRLLDDAEQALNKGDVDKSVTLLAEIACRAVQDRRRNELVKDARYIALLSTPAIKAALLNEARAQQFEALQLLGAERAKIPWEERYA